jgi:hypothetical protein
MHSIITQLPAFAFSTARNTLSSPSYVQLIYFAHALFTCHTEPILASFRGRALFTLHIMLVFFMSRMNATLAPLLSFAFIWFCGAAHVYLGGAIWDAYGYQDVGPYQGELGEEGDWQ